MPSGHYKRSKAQIERQKEMARKLGLLNKGSNHPQWKGGVTPIRKKLYFSDEYFLWRTSVFIRDNYTCKWCGKKGGTLNADHIKTWADYPELRFAIDNGRTLCFECHKKTETYCSHDNTSGIRGVGFHKGKNKWRARFSKIHLGWFNTKEEAAEVYKNYVK